MSRTLGKVARELVVRGQVEDLLGRGLSESRRKKVDELARRYAEVVREEAAADATAAAGGGGAGHVGSTIQNGSSAAGGGQA
jgi:hypothetical protein